MISATRFLLMLNGSLVLLLGVTVGWAFTPVERPVAKMRSAAGPMLPAVISVSIEHARAAPIFNPERTLSSEAPTGSAPPPVLTGIIAQGQGLGLVLVGDKQEIIGIGRETAGWRLLSVSARAATFTRGGATITVKLLADKRQPLAGPPNSPGSLSDAAQPSPIIGTPQAQPAAPSFLATPAPAAKAD